MNSFISIIIPCYNSEKSLCELIKRIDLALKDIYRYEIICVNDCSRDNTINVLEDLSNNYPQLKVIDMVYNIGQFRALMCGFEHSKGEIIVTIDDDLQHKPEDIPLLINHLISNPQLDVVIASFSNKKHKAYRNLGTLLIRWINKNIFNKPKNLQTSSFRAIRRIIVDALIEHKTAFPVVGPLILSITTRIENHQVEHCPRKYGKSGYKLSKLIATTFDNVLNFSSLPLKFISIIGVGASFLSFIIFIGFILKYLFIGIDVPGWTSLILIISFYSGLILLSIGIIGEYLIRILKESNHSPRYMIRKTLNF